VMCIALHTMCFGQPHRAAPLARLFRHLRGGRRLARDRRPDRRPLSAPLLRRGTRARDEERGPVNAARLPGTTSDPYTRWSPLPERPRLRWPGGAGLAVVVMVSLEHVLLEPDQGSRI